MRSIQQLQSGFIAPLGRYGLIRASGEDAADFIHGQLSHDIASLKADLARYAGYCTPEGRLLAIMLVWKSSESVWMMVPRDILPGLMRRLQIYILRAKVALTDVSEAFSLYGLGGKKARDVMPSVFPQVSERTGSKVECAAGTFIRLTDAFDGPRFLWVAPAKDAATAGTAPFTALYPADDEDWALGGIEAGMPEIVEATQNRFVPQMMNMELIDAMSFTKGCYPGQEIIARTQYRGAIKRRMFRAHAAIPGETTAFLAGIHPGMNVFDVAAPDQPCGIVAQAARYDGQRIDCLMVIPKALAASGSLHLGAPDGPLLLVTPLPYPLPDEDDKS